MKGYKFATKWGLNDGVHDIKRPLELCYFIAF